METFEIPKHEVEAFKKLFSLKNRIDSIIDIFNSSIDSEEELSIKINSKFNIDESLANEIVFAVAKLLLSRNSSNVSEEVFIETILKSLELDKEVKFKRYKGIENDLVKLLNIEGTFFIKIKAYDLVSDRHKLLFKSRIITDVRPVFNEKENFEVVSNIIIQNLKIEYVEDDILKKIYLALDHSDLLSLKENIDRALKKEDKIKEQLDNANFKTITI